MRKISIALALVALCNPTSIPSDYMIRNRGKIPDPSPGKIPKKKHNSANRHETCTIEVLTMDKVEKTDKQTLRQPSAGIFYAI